MAIKASKMQMMMMNALNDQSIVDDFQPMFAEVDAEFQAKCVADFGSLGNAAMMARKQMMEAEEDNDEAMEGGERLRAELCERALRGRCWRDAATTEGTRHGGGVRGD